MCVALSSAFAATVGEDGGCEAYVSAGPMGGGAATSLLMGARPGARGISRAISGEGMCQALLGGVGGNGRG